MVKIIYAQLFQLYVAARGPCLRDGGVPARQLELFLCASGASVPALPQSKCHRKGQAGAGGALRGRRFPKRRPHSFSPKKQRRGVLGGGRPPTRRACAPPPRRGPVAGRRPPAAAAPARGEPGAERGRGTAEAGELQREAAAFVRRSPSSLRAAVPAHGAPRHACAPQPRCSCLGGAAAGARTPAARDPR